VIFFWISISACVHFGALTLLVWQLEQSQPVENHVPVIRQGAVFGYVKIALSA